MKKIYSLFLAALFLITALPVSAASFSDVPQSSKYYDAVSLLSDGGIITGYEDGTFRPGGTITRAEAAAIIVRTRSVPEENLRAPSGTYYRDVPVTHWALPYIRYATDAGIVNGYEDSFFGPEDPVTYHQILKMICCAFELEHMAAADDSWPYAYVRIAEAAGIIDEETKTALLQLLNGIQPATRGDTALYLYNYSARAAAQKTITVAGKDYYIGMPQQDLGKPDEMLPSTYGFDWYVYGTKTYEDFFAAGVQSGKVVALASSGKGFQYGGYASGDTVDSLSPQVDRSNLYTDSNDGDRIHGVFIYENASAENLSAKAFAGESKINLHFTNAFRVYHGEGILTWCDNAAEAARLHSADMGANNYVAHNSQDGTKFSERMKRQGVTDFYATGENIVAGNSSGFSAYDSWVNSAGHRENLLNDYTHLGVGGAYSTNATYRYYFTQDFYRK